MREREERGITASLTVVHDCVFSSGILSLPIFLGIWRIEGDESGVTQVTAFPLSLSLSPFVAIWLHLDYLPSLFGDRRLRNALRSINLQNPGS